MRLAAFPHLIACLRPPKSVTLSTFQPTHRCLVAGEVHVVVVVINADCGRGMLHLTITKQLPNIIDPVFQGLKKVGFRARSNAYSQRRKRTETKVMTNKHRR